jgi:hypothetical protein
MILLLTLGACAKPPIEWREPAPLSFALPGATALTFDSAQKLVPEAAPEVPLPEDAHQCPESVRVSRDTTGGWYAVWWSLRADSSADLVVARMRDAAPWERAIRVDTLDVGREGCRRPAPSIQGEGANVHVAYAMTAREGPGIFASHSMDHGMLFHSPVPVVYGARIGLTSIAARGNVVAVAYEDPNSDPLRIGVALSHSQGHLFETRETVSLPTGAAREPHVALGERLIAVAWSQSAATGAEIVRIGALR